tara:strand:+ start:673 stop:1098 length:426 start_codon:yes stop_codon:yes gene_type:complete
MVNSRNKGATFEREICNLFNLELGAVFNFRRDLEQYRSASHGDVSCDDPNWPFVVELKRYASGPHGGQTAWWNQAKTAAVAVNKAPILIYKYDRQHAVCMMELKTIAASFGVTSPSITKYYTSVAGFIYLAREVMAHEATG